MEIEMLDIDHLKEYENNPRYNDDAVKYVANSINEFGFKNPIIVDSDNNIIAGHTRKLAAKELGIEQVPVIRASDLNEQQIRAFRLADNKVAEISTWNMDLLQDEIIELEDNFDIGEFGFDPIEIYDFDTDSTNLTEYNQIEDDEDYRDHEEETYEEDEKPRGYSITYEIAFNNEDEQERWYEFLGTLRKEYPDVDTIAQRILLAVEAWKSGR